jgi:hypothetical protein
VGRLIAALVAFVLAWLGVLNPSMAMAAAPPTPPVAVFAYNGHHDSVQLIDANDVRGPPPTYDGHTTYAAVDRGSHGASPRPESGTSLTTYGYNHRSVLDSCTTPRMAHR